jgi:hypothetical protein
MRRTDLWRTVRDLARWHRTTQIGARRNALVACTELAQRRREREDVELFLSRTKPADTALPHSPMLRAAEVIPTPEVAG